MIEKIKALDRTRLILLLIIAVSIPCYCLGMVLLWRSSALDGRATATPTETQSGTDGADVTPTFTIPAASPTPTYTSTVTPTFTATITYAIPPTFTPTPSQTPSPSPTDTAEPTATDTLEPSATSTETPTNTGTLTVSPDTTVEGE